MRTKGTYREITHPVTGQKMPSMYPLTREEAINEGVAKYWPQTPCPLHGGNPVYYTVTGYPGCCAHEQAANEYDRAHSMDEPMTLGAASAAGRDYYWKPTVNPRCGHIGMTKFDGTCYLCARARSKSPQVAARHAGEIWYTPALNDPCLNGHTTRRRVSNSSCEECEQARVALRRAARPTVIPNGMPDDYVIDRESARAMGFKAYRTGKPCLMGHTGWRYVTSSNCIECHNESRRALL